MTDKVEELSFYSEDLDRGSLDLKFEYNDKMYHVEMGTVTSTHIGYEDHGIFSIAISFRFNSAEQSLGHYVLNDVQILKELIRVFQINSWEGITGRQIYILRESKFGLIKGLLSLDSNEVFIMDEITKE